MTMLRRRLPPELLARWDALSRPLRLFAIGAVAILVLAVAGNVLRACMSSPASAAATSLDAEDSGHRVYVLAELAHSDGSTVACDPAADWQDALVTAGVLDPDVYAVCALPIR